MKTVECLRIVFRVFPEGDGGEVDVEWMCTICFEGDLEEKDEEESGDVKTIGAKCSLPCGHKCTFTLARPTFMESRRCFY